MAYKLLPNGKHHWSFRLGGRHGKRRRVTHSDFRQGEKEVRRVQYEFENGISAGDPKQGATFHDICNGYKDDRTEEPGVTHQKKKTISSQIACFERDIPNYKLQSFSVEGHKAYNAVGHWMKAYLTSTNRLGGAISPHSVNRKFNTLRAVFNWAINKGLMTTNPCRRAKKLKTAKPLPRFLAQKEIDALLATARRPQFVNYCTLILNTGLRPSEALGLQVEHVDMESRVISGFKQKNSRELGSVPVKDSLVGPLTDLLANRVTGSLLGYTAGELREDAEYGIAKAKVNARIKPGTSKFTIYGLRHTFASHMLMAGEDMATVAKWLRNGISICFEHYGHLNQKFLVDAGNKIDLVPKMQLKVF